MKQFYLTTVILLFVFLNSSFSQQFIQEWEFPGWLTYVGDIDGDGVGEFVKYDEFPPNTTTIFYDAQTHNPKWIINDKYFDGAMFGSEHAFVHSSYLIFPSIDFNGDGKREFFFAPSDNKGILIVDVVNNTIVFEWTNSQISWTNLVGLADVDGDNNLELIFITGTDGVGYKTYVYSTGIQTTAIKEEYEIIPDNLKVSQNYPNPFNPSTTIDFQISQPCIVKINIYDISGRIVKELINEQKNSGNYSIKWDGKDNNGNSVASGTYFYQIISGDFTRAKKMILLK